MKHISILLLAIVLSIGGALAQSDDHIKFMGISLSGLISDIRPKLERVGFKYTGSAGTDKYHFTGKMDAKTVLLTIIVTPITKQVMCMNLDYPFHQNRSDAFDDYTTMSYTLSGVTGESASITDESNLQQDTLAETHWDVPEGTIKLSLSSELGLSLMFMDRINGLIHYKENKSLGNL